MRKLGFILGFLMLTFGVNAQVKQNENGLYIDSDGSLFTGILENKENNVKQSEIEIKNGQFNGEARYYYASGSMMEIGLYQNGLKDGKWLRFNESGVTIGLAMYSLGKKNGTSIVWDDMGKKRFEMHYIMGEKAGVWNNWGDNGELISSKDFSTTN